MRFQSPTSGAIASMVLINAFGLSHTEISRQLGFCANAVPNCLRVCQIKARDTHRWDCQVHATPGIADTVVPNGNLHR